jgi:hypothetical protein
MDDLLNRAPTLPELQVALDLVLEGKKLIATPDRWTKFAFARDGADEAVNELDARAYKFCMRGALNRAYLNRGLSFTHPAFQHVLDTFTKVLNGKGMTGFNDDSPEHARVIGAFDEVASVINAEVCHA